MKLFTRYIVAEFLKVFVVWVAGFTSLFLVGGVVKEASDQGLGPAQVARMLPYLLPDALQFTIPGAVLISACVCFGRMSGSNEIVAIKALGISPMAALWPPLLIGLALSLLPVWLNDVAASWGRSGLQRLVISSVDEIAYGMLRMQNSYVTDRFSINVRGVDGRTLLRPTIVFNKGDGSSAMTLTADEAELYADPARDVLQIVSRNSTVTIEGIVKLSNPDEMTHDIPLADATKKGRKRFNPSQLTLGDIPAAIREKRAEIALRERRLAALAALQFVEGDLRGIQSDQWRADAGFLNDLWEQVHRLYAERHRRWATGFSCFAFVLVGAPLAIRLRNHDFLTNFFICFAPILLVYYPLLAATISASKSGDLPAISIWLGDALISCIGIGLVRQVLRY